MKAPTGTLAAVVFSAAVLLRAQSIQQPLKVEIQEHTKVDAQAEVNIEANTEVMESTFKIVGQTSYGSGFILGRPYNEAGKEHVRFVLVTAAHVLSENQGESVTVYFRRQTPLGAWESVPAPLRIRNGTEPLWKQHPSADIAVMYMDIPQAGSVFRGGVMYTDRLADDSALREYAVHPGDDVACAGFPFGDESKPYGFPILRTGRIASYPLLPTAETKTFLLDFAVFPGNSGGPAFVVFPAGRNNQSKGKLLVMGLVSNEQIAFKRIPLGIAEVVHATLISEAISQLPPPNER